jgi:hypothetical protein
MTRRATLFVLVLVMAVSAAAIVAESDAPPAMHRYLGGMNQVESREFAYFVVPWPVN